MSAASRDMDGDIGLCNPALSMRTGSDQQWGIVRIHRIEMDAKSQHPIKQALLRSDMLNTRLHGPWAKAGLLDAMFHRNRAILMPAKRPVGCGALVEQDRADGSARRTETGRSMMTDRAGRCEHPRKNGEVGKALSGTVGRMIREFRFEMADCRFIQR